MGKLTISMTIFNSYVRLPEGMFIGIMYSVAVFQNMYTMTPKAPKAFDIFAHPIPSGNLTVCYWKWTSK